MTQQKILIDVTVLIAASLVKRKSTGIERVALAYVQHFHNQASAVITIRGYLVVLSNKVSQQIFKRLLSKQSTPPISLIFQVIKNFIMPTSKNRGNYLLKIDDLWLTRDSYYHGLKRRGILPIIMIHDLIPIEYPEYCHSHCKNAHHRRITNILTHAQGILTNSEATYKEVVNYANNKKLALPPIISALLGFEHISRSSINPRPITASYFVILGTIEGRKNHLLLLQLWRILVDRYKENAPKLVIIGQRGWKCKNVLDMLKQCDKIRNCVIELAATDVELITYLHYAQALLYPTFTEGYGLPLVEALSAGIPVIASDLDVFKEIAGNVPDYIHPIDGAKWLATIEEYTSKNSILRKSQIDRIKGLDLPTWTGHFNQVESFLEYLKTN